MGKPSRGQRRIHPPRRRGVNGTRKTSTNRRRTENSLEERAALFVLRQLDDCALLSSACLGRVRSSVSRRGRLQPHDTTADNDIHWLCLARLFLAFLEQQTRISSSSLQGQLMCCVSSDALLRAALTPEPERETTSQLH